MKRPRKHGAESAKRLLMSLRLIILGPVLAIGGSLFYGSIYGSLLIKSGKDVLSPPPDPDSPITPPPVTPQRPNPWNMTWLRGVDNGGLGVSGGVHGTDYEFNDSTGVLTILTNTKILIQNQNSNVATADRILVKKNVSANAVLIDVNIDVRKNAAAALEIEDDSTGDVRIELFGWNRLKSAPGYAGLQKSCINVDGDSGSLAIDGLGSLTAIGGNGGAGIGGGAGRHGKNITISRATVLADGGAGAAGIGGGSGGIGGNIAIIDSKIIAMGGSAGAGIGGGYCETSMGITISKSVVTATGGTLAQSIGSGDSNAFAPSNYEVAGRIHESTNRGSADKSTTSAVIAGNDGGLIFDNGVSPCNVYFTMYEKSVAADQDSNNSSDETTVVTYEVIAEQDLNIPSNVTMTVTDGFTLTIKKEGAALTLRNDGKIVNNGTIKVYGSFVDNGTFSGNPVVIC